MEHYWRRLDGIGVEKNVLRRSSSVFAKFIATSRAWPTVRCMCITGPPMQPPPLRWLLQPPPRDTEITSFLVFPILPEASYLLWLQLAIIFSSSWSSLAIMVMYNSIWWSAAIIPRTNTDVVPPCCAALNLQAAMVKHLHRQHSCWYQTRPQLPLVQWWWIVVAMPCCYWTILVMIVEYLLACVRLYQRILWGSYESAKCRNGVGVKNIQKSISVQWGGGRKRKGEKRCLPFNDSSRDLRTALQDSYVCRLIRQG